MVESVLNIATRTQHLNRTAQPVVVLTEAELLTAVVQRLCIY